MAIYPTMANAELLFDRAASLPAVLASQSGTTFKG